MELREYMSIRRAYNLVRKDATPDRRLTFEEFAILAHLYKSSEPVKVSQIASWQQVLRPTMTHRINHLVKRGLIERHGGEDDRRTICCSITEKGIQVLNELSDATNSATIKGYALHNIGRDRMIYYIDASGSFFCSAGDLPLLGIKMLGGSVHTITELVDCLGLLQPTVSMSVANLVDDGLLKRNNVSNGKTTRTVDLVLTDKGEKRAQELIDQIAEIVVRRNRRKKAEILAERQ